jgi:hypothetical protein
MPYRKAPKNTYSAMRRAIKFELKHNFPELNMKEPTKPVLKQLEWAYQNAKRLKLNLSRNDVVFETLEAQK